MTVSELNVCFTNPESKLYRLGTAVAGKEREILLLMDESDGITLYDYIFLRKVSCALSLCTDDMYIRP